MKPPTPNLFASLYDRVKTILRLFQLMVIFSPVVILSPLSLFELTEDIWYWVFVKAIEQAGVVWIKSFQYLSHRHDIIGERMAMKFMHLREHAPAHPFKDTQMHFRREFGKSVDQIFDKFYDPPIASGSISQVYSAEYRGERVAVKVRHPNVQKNIKRDVDLLFGISKALSYISSAFELPITKSTLTKTLIDQLDFRIES
jgi:predicted unusual protein kinase regulating ubiquinone biosynthesis (AarF/ABC1/UbiB family)